MTSVAELRKIIDVEEGTTDSSLEIFVTSANLIRTEDLSDVGLSSMRLDLIELYLAAHFFVVAKEFGGIQEWDNGQARERYKTIDQKAVGLNATRYGQQVLAFDTSGTLLALFDTRLKALFGTIGSNRADYDNAEYLS